MGLILSRVFQALFGSKEVRILILGLDNAGKTTILYRLQNEADDNIQTIPTIGFNVETLQYKNIKFQVRCSCCFSLFFSYTGTILVFPLFAISFLSENNEEAINEPISLLILIYITFHPLFCFYGEQNCRSLYQ